jgi:CTP:molybdopterin cytidylyltransferase MocA
MSARPIVDIVLAAGRGTRVGGTKGLLDLGGRPLLTRVLDEVVSSHGLEALVVVGAEAERVLPLTNRPRVRALVNRDLASEQLASIRMGLAALPGDSPAFLIHPVDHCLVRRSLLEALVTAFLAAKDQDSAIVRPRFGDRWGHPVLFARRHAQEFLALQPGDSGRAVYGRHHDRVIAVDAPDDDCLFDLDTPEDLVEARRRLAQIG